MGQQQVKDLGEQEILRRLKAFCPHEIIGDDGAVLTPEPDHKVIVTTDVLVDNVHFSDRTTPPDSVGWRAAAANLSDLAAMGAKPIGLTIGLGVPENCPMDWIEALYRGVHRCLCQCDAVILGGDLCRSTVRSVAITAIGQALPHNLIRRHTAQPGDAILVTGVHGASRAGLEVLLKPEQARSVTDAQQQSWIHAHQYPQPRLDILPLLAALWHDPLTRSIAGMDSSDGLADAVLQICRASGCGAQIDRQHLPIPPGLATWVGEAKALEWTLYGGEDFELVLCLPIEMAEQLCAQLGDRGTIVGKVISDSAVFLQNPDGTELQSLNLEQGFQHFTSQL